MLEWPLSNTGEHVMQASRTEVSLTDAKRSIVLIDRQIDQVRLALEMLECVKPFSAESWQAAWDKHPELRAQEKELFRQRGEAQRDRAAAEHRNAMREARTKRRLNKCPTCGNRTLAA